MVTGHFPSIFNHAAPMPVSARTPPPQPAACIHLRIKLLGRGMGVVIPGHVVGAEVVGAVGRVPDVVAAGPGQRAGEG